MTTDKETNLLFYLGDVHSTLSQRQLAKRAGISIGLVNSILRKLMNTGYVRTRAINRRQLQYCLTPNGLVEVARRSRRYVTDTIKSYRAIQESTVELISSSIEDGYDCFILRGDKVLCELVASAVHRTHNVDFILESEPLPAERRVMLLNLDEVSYCHPKFPVMNVMERLVIPR